MLTVMFATRNGAKLLRDVLSNYEQLASPLGGWHLVIVDSASTDETPSILNSFLSKLPLTILRAERPGKNIALNKGLAAIEGDLVVLTDDDTFPRHDWLIELRRAADEHPQASLFGGKVLPRWEVPPADWITRLVPKGPVFTLTEPQKHVEGPIDPNLIFGPNMAVRAEIFRKGLCFDESIGPSGANYAMGSESEFTARLARAGFATWFCDRAVVEHFIRRPQLDRSWILKRAIRFGRGRYRLNDRFVDPAPPTWFGIPRYLYRQIVGDSAALLRETLFGSEETQFQTHWKLNFCFGQMLEARKIGQAAKTSL